MRKWASGSPVSAGVALVVAGFVALFLAWNGAAGKDYIEGQLPYLISGGLVGLGLIGAGLTVINVQARRADQAELLAKLETLLVTRDAAREAEPPPEPTPIRRTRKKTA